VVNGTWELANGELPHPLPLFQREQTGCEEKVMLNKGGRRRGKRNDRKGRKSLDPEFALSAFPSLREKEGESQVSILPSLGKFPSD